MVKEKIKPFPAFWSLKANPCNGAAPAGTLTQDFKARAERKIVITSLFLLTTVLHPAIAASKWTESGYADFRDGSFLDGGSNLYVSARGRLQMINRWDLNGDGFLDLLLPSGHGHTEKENTYLYLNSGRDIDGRSRLELPGNGSRDGLVADFNKDGYNDLAVANHSNSHVRKVDAWVFYGTAEGFTAAKRAELPASRATSIAAGDFNGDAWLDLAIACQWEADNGGEGEGKRRSFIYWNGPEGFDRANRLALTFDGGGAGDFSAGDLDGDGIDDLIALAGEKTYLLFSSRNAFLHPVNRQEWQIAGVDSAIGDVDGDGFKEIAIASQGAVRVFRGGPSGFSSSHPIALKVETPREVVLADCDGDGWDDVVVANYASQGGATWTHSMVFYSDGGDFTGRDSLSLPTLGASGVSAGDLNGDGLPELVFSNLRITNQYRLLSYVYWNEQGRFRFGNHSQLATEGSVANTIGDVNNDGLPDVVFFNDEGGFRDGPSKSHIYWGDGTRDFSITRRTTFPTHHIFGQAQADFDDDGYVDIVLSQSGFIDTVDHNQSGLIFYWGGPDGFTGPTNLSMGNAYGGVRAADIDGDGYLDLVAGGYSVDPNNPGRRGFPIFWGSPEGFQHRRRTIIPFDTLQIRAPLLMDLNRDGRLDIAGQLEFGKFTIWWGDEKNFTEPRSTEFDLGRGDQLMYIKGADFNKDGWLDLLLPHRGPPDGTETTSFLYYGSSNGYTGDNRIELRSYVPYQNSIADFDRDGWLDIFLTSYGGEVSGNRPSLIYWGGPDGFDARPRAELPTYGSSGSETADYDGDGWIDILVANHRRSGSTVLPIPHRHITESMLYWGGPEGFSPERRWTVEAVGPSGLNLRDVGNSYDRGLYEDYVSSPHRVPEGEHPVLIRWEAETPHQTALRFQIRASDSETGLPSAKWWGPAGEGTWFRDSGSRIEGNRGGWIQYRARLITPNGGPTPYLTSVTIEFE